MTVELPNSSCSSAVAGRKRPQATSSVPPPKSKTAKRSSPNLLMSGSSAGCAASSGQTSAAKASGSLALMATVISEAGMPWGMLRRMPFLISSSSSLRARSSNLAGWVSQ